MAMVNKQIWAGYHLKNDVNFTLTNACIYGIKIVWGKLHHHVMRAG